MPWPIPQPADIESRAAGVMEAAITEVYQAQNNGALPPEPVDVRSPDSVGAIFNRTLALSEFDLWLFQAREGQELMPDTAQDWLSRHGAIWGVPQGQPVPASGNLVLPGGQIDTVVPSGFQFSAPGNAVYEVINAGTIPGAGSFSIGISAAVAGMSGNLASGVTLTSVVPLAGLVSQSGTVDPSGITGGANLEGPDSWRSRILARIRQRGGGGDADDFEQWLREVLPGASVLAFSPGLGQITVAFAMPVLDGNGNVTAWRVPTSTELSIATAYLNDATNRKPLGAPAVSVIAATLQPVSFTLHLNPTSTTIEQGVSNALGLYFVSNDITIGATLDMSRSDAAIDSTTGLYDFDRSVPAADVAPGTVTSLLTLGTVAFV